MIHKKVQERKKESSRSRIKEGLLCRPEPNSLFVGEVTAMVGDRVYKHHDDFTAVITTADTVVDTSR